MFSLSSATKRAGVSKATIHRALNSGKLSGTRQGDRSYRIDPRELSRVYTVTPETTGPVAEGANETIRNPPNPALNGHDDPFAAVLVAELAGARDLIRLLEAQAEALRRDRDAQVGDLQHDRDGWRQQAEPAQLPLTHARETPPPPPPPARTWWQRLMG